MYRLLIVDDNLLDRNGLQQVLDWSTLDIEIVGTCINGREAIEQTEILKPDIILTDIAMPVMNGIEMAEKLKETHPWLKIIFMSCYSDFDFAKSAVDLDIYGYVLKPIVPCNLEEVVKKVLDICKGEKQQKKEKESMLKQIKESLPLVQEQFLKDLLLGNFRKIEEVKRKADFLQLELGSRNNIRVLSIELDDGQNPSDDKNITDTYWVSYMLKNMINSFSDKNINVYTVQILDKDFAVLIFYSSLETEPPIDADVKSSDSSYILDLIINIHTRISSGLNAEVSIGMSKGSNRLSDLPELYKQAVSARNTMFCSGDNPIILYEEIESTLKSSFEGKINLGELYKEIKSLISSYDESDIQGFINHYLGSENVRLDESYVKSVTMTILNMMMVLLLESEQTFADVLGDETIVWKKLSDFKSIVDVKQWLFNIFRAIEECLEIKSNNKNIIVIDKIKQIIHNRYHEQFPLEEISKEVYLSFGYANSLFKKETGKTIFNYLVEYRMEMAKKLLKEPDCKVAVVAECVGYENKSYFGLLFKRYYGVTPAEYKNKPIL